MTAAVDMSCLQDATDGDAELTKKIVGIFARQALVNLDILRQSCADNDLPLWRDTAHTFKGSAGSVGAEALATLCNTAQLLDGDAPGQEALLRQISDEYARVQDHFKAHSLLD